ncbi:VOC family protein [soil metagenome]
MTTIPTGRFVWFEYAAADLAKAQGFFGELFNWGSQAVPMANGAYTMISSGGTMIGGYLPPTPGAPPHWLSHLQVEDAEASAKQVVTLGGAVIKPVFETSIGKTGIVADPLGGVFALWQPVSRAPGGDYLHTYGTFCWNELPSADPLASAAFYGAIGGFELDSMEMAHGTYHTLKKAGLPQAGIMKSPMPNMPQSWLPYVLVQSCEQSLAKAQKLGAKMVLPPTTVPRVGTFSVFADPAGGVLGILESSNMPT